MCIVVETFLNLFLRQLPHVHINNAQIKYYLYCSPVRIFTHTHTHTHTHTLKGGQDVTVVWMNEGHNCKVGDQKIFFKKMTVACIFSAEPNMYRLSKACE